MKMKYLPTEIVNYKLQFLRITEIYVTEIKLQDLGNVFFDLK